ncbi:MAG: hypothetical protein KDD33_02110 [Bdellovibrionales bacterium]|nr:hypothetical protein [Bdellovibrionales bacterium]
MISNIPKRSLMAITNYIELRQDIDKLIVSFEVKKAQSLLKAMDIKSIPKKMRADFAALARRAGSYRLALRILNSNVYGADEASAEDTIEYASSLRRLGLINQALNLLKRVEHYPTSFLHQAFCHMHLWDYKSSQDCFIEFLSRDETKPYDQLIAKVNLISCFVENSEYQKAELLLQKVKMECIETSPHLLLNCLETEGQMLIRQGKMSQAIEVLQNAYDACHGEDVETTLFIEKWLLVAKCASGHIEEIDPRIGEFKKRIRSFGHWETLRDFEWQIAKIFNNRSLLNYVYFGTPFASFRSYILNHLGVERLPGSFIWMDGRSQDSIDINIDLHKVEDVPLPFGMGVHRLWMLLASDFYRPWSIGRIFNSLFPDELYDPSTSPKKVYRLIEKLQEAIEKNDIKIEMRTTPHGYRLRPKPGCIFYVHETMEFASQEHFLLYLLKKNGFSNQISVKELQEVIPLSQHQWYRALKKMEEADLIKKDEHSHYSLAS